MKNCYRKLLFSLTVFCFIYKLQGATVSLTSTSRQQEQGIKIQVFKDIKEFTKQNSNLQLKPLQKKVKYTLGNRVEGDSLLAEFSDTYYFVPGLKHGSSQVSYPEKDKGSTITFIDIRLQNDTEGKAYVVNGGIGERFISILLETTQAESFVYKVYVYGKD